MTRKRCPCGKAFDALSPRATYCSAACRKRASRAGLRIAADVPTVIVREQPATVEAAVRAELKAANATEKAAGMAAIRLAQLVDEIDETKASSAAATLVREMRAALADAVAKAPAAVDDPIDELKARRVAAGG